MTDITPKQMVELRISRPGVKWEVKAISPTGRRILVGSATDRHLPIWVAVEDVIA